MVELGSTGMFGITGTTGDYDPMPKRNKIKVGLLNELRIGSFIISNGEMIKVDPFFFILKTRLKGIKLTERMLLFLGFRKQKNYEWNDNEDREIEVDPYYFDTQIPIHEIISFPGIFVRDKKLSIMGRSYPGLRYLHQLQNAYLCFTGEELIIDEKGLDNYLHERQKRKIKKHEDKISKQIK